MERLSDHAIEIINELHTERLDYTSEYLPLIDVVNLLAAYEDTGLEPEEIIQGKELAELACALEQLKKYRTVGSVEYFRKLAEADREGRIYIWQKVFRCPKCGSYNLAPRVDDKFYYCHHCKAQLTSEEVEAILGGRESK